jgi:hypothetical protein
MRSARLVMGLAIVMAAVVSVGRWEPVAAGGMDGGYRVLKPIESGDLMLFPVVKADGKMGGADEFLTLDEGLKSGEVEVTEAGKVRGLVRSRGGVAQSYQGDQVNTLVLVNHSKRPLLLLAGEIVTGGKQDRIIAKDRIVPVGAEPIDLSVFCIEHGRWTESSTKFGASANVGGAKDAKAESFMVQPTVRQQAMVAKDQQQVWNSVNETVTVMAAAAAPMPTPGTTSAGGLQQGVYAGTGQTNLNEDYIEGTISNQQYITTPLMAARSLGTTSYAKAMQNEAVSKAVDKETAGMAASREQALATLRQEHAVGVVVAVRGEVIWADIFSDTGLLTKYWTKLVRSYAAEGLGGAGSHGTATMAEAQRFLDTPMQGTEQSEGEVGVYRNREVKSGGTDLFTLEALLPGTGYDVHVSRVKLKGEAEKGMVRPPRGVIIR